MGTGSSTGQGRDTTYGTRDARQFSAETSYWPELAGAKLAESSGTGQKPHSMMTSDCNAELKTRMPM